MWRWKYKGTNFKKGRIDMNIKRSEFWEWMNTCPIKEETGKPEGWLHVNDYFESIEIRFPVDEDVDKMTHERNFY